MGLPGTLGLQDAPGLPGRVSTSHLHTGLLRPGLSPQVSFIAPPLSPWPLSLPVPYCPHSLRCTLLWAHTTSSGCSLHPRLRNPVSSPHTSTLTGRRLSITELPYLT